MKNRVIYIIALSFIWVGFIGAISFMEAWIKFQAPGITTKLGLGIGQLVFSALNKMEITCAILIIGLNSFKSSTEKHVLKSLFLIPVLILVIQSFWILPILNNRANLIISGVEVPKSNLHFWYVLLESVKLIGLVVFGVRMTKRLRNRTLKENL